MELTREIHARWPDYLFARCRLADAEIVSGSLDEARRLLDPLLMRSRFHFSEFRALASVISHLNLAEGNIETATEWLGLCERTEPDHPATRQNRRLVDEARRRLHGSP
jgi:hypothetical protein